MIVFQIPRSVGVRPYIFCTQFSGVVELNFDSVVVMTLLWSFGTVPHFSYNFFWSGPIALIF